MRNYRYIILTALVAFASAVTGVVVGREYVAPERQVENELHDLLHRQLTLDDRQKAMIEKIEREFAVRRRELENVLRADNARLAAAIEAEHGYGPKVAAAVDLSHQAMGQLQKETLEHIFAMRSVLKPDQAAQFDKTVVKALTAGEK